MLTGQRSVTRRQSRKTRRAALIAVPLGITVALGATVGVVVAISSHGTTDVNQSAFGRHHQPGGSPSATPTATGSATASPSATPSTSATGTGTGTAAVP